MDQIKSLYSFGYLIKIYLLYAICKTIFIICHKLAIISEEKLKLYEILYEQNKSILQKNAVELLLNQYIYKSSEKNERDELNSKKSELNARLSAINFDDFK